jgi:DNA-binding response OmpR family regulator
MTESRETVDISIVQGTLNLSIPAILIVDDDPWFRAFARTILENASHVVVDAESVEEGERVLHTTIVSLMIADIMMPGMPGFSIIASARREFPTMKILAVSGSQDGCSHMARMAGADSTLGKPVTPERLLESVRLVLQ